MWKRYAISIAVAVVAGVAIGVAVHAATSRAKAPALDGQATWPSGARPAPAFALHDQHGRIVSLASLRGRSVALTFMDSLCKSACPLEGRMLASAIAQLPDSAKPRLVIVSVDPAGDTPTTVAHAARKWDLPPDTAWLLGDKRSLARVWRHYDITVDARSGDVIHSTAVYLIDKHGDERAGFLMPFLPNLVAGDFRTLART